MRSLSRVIYPRHFAALAAAAVVLAASHRYRSSSAVTSAAVYGALYSSVTVMTLRGRYTMRRKLLFVGAAALLSGLSFAVSIYGGRSLGWSAPIEYLVIGAAVGAIAYAQLLRRAFFTDLSLRALLLAPLASVLAVVALVLAGLYSRNIDVLAVAWWFAFSAGLWCEDCRASG